MVQARYLGQAKNRKERGREKNKGKRRDGKKEEFYQVLWHIWQTGWNLSDFSRSKSKLKGWKGNVGRGREWNIFRVGGRREEGTKLA